jgi:hypothetical protein
MGNAAAPKNTTRSFVFQRSASTNWPTSPRLNLLRSSRYQSSATSSACESSSRFVVARYCLPPTDAAGWRGHKPTSRWAQPDLSGSAPLFGRVILQASANRAHPIHDFSWPADGPISRAPETSRTHQRPSLPRHHRYSAHGIWGAGTQGSVPDGQCAWRACACAGGHRA